MLIYHFTGKTGYITAILFFLIGYTSSAQSLKRQALIDFTVKVIEVSTTPIIFDAVPESSAFYAAGIRNGDNLISINGIRIINALLYQKMTQQWRSNTKIKLVVKRKNQLLSLQCIPLARPLETIENCTTTYDEVKTSNGYSVRMIVTKPKNTTAPLPVIFFIQWLSCDQVELNRKAMDGWANLIEDLATKSGCILVRTEKPGLGDSDGPDCSECDLKNEIAAYKASFEKMQQYDFVDNENIIILGGSIGGAIAPIIAEGQNVKGIISTGGFSTTWYEHILDFERNRLFFSGTKTEQIDSLMKKFTSFYAEYLIKKRKPSEIIKATPAYKTLWYQENDLQFGRPVKYYQQLQDLNIGYYWSKINCPVLVVYGEYDWIMSKAEQENIIQLLNRKKEGTAELKIIPGMNHHYSKYTSPQEAFDEPFIKYDPTGFEYMKNWIKQLIKQ